MAKKYYDQPIDRTYDWGGDRKTGGLQVKGNRVQEYIQGELDASLRKEDNNDPSSLLDD